jgi:hypothetical protein
MVGRPFCDYLNISVPVEHTEALRDLVLPVLRSAGQFAESDTGDVFQFFTVGVRKGNVVVVPSGTVKFGRRGKVATLSTSGQALGILRASSALPEYLAAIGSLPHRVTMLHATADFHLPDVPAAIHAVKDAAYAGELALTRKKIQPGQCRHFFGVDFEGKETGTVYLGQRANADVWAKVYDKGHQMACAGLAHGGSIARVEVAAMSDVGATLRDASNPSDLFFHFAGRSLVEAPPDFSGWLAHGEGYVLGEKVERTLFERFERFLENSRDIHTAARMALELYGADIAPQALGRKILAMAHAGV